jgi:PleD family two-component response regulator
MTAFVEGDMSIDRAKEAGCNDFDTKPINWRRLTAKIEDLIDSAG